MATEMAESEQEDPVGRQILRIYALGQLLVWFVLSFRDVPLFCHYESPNVAQVIRLKLLKPSTGVEFHVTSWVVTDHQGTSSTAFILVTPPHCQVQQQSHFRHHRRNQAAQGVGSAWHMRFVLQRRCQYEHGMCWRFSGTGLISHDHFAPDIDINNQHFDVEVQADILKPGALAWGGPSRNCPSSRWQRGLAALFGDAIGSKNTSFWMIRRWFHQKWWVVLALDTYVKSTSLDDLQMFTVHSGLH